jgi:hypothetical protein
MNIPEDQLAAALVAKMAGMTLKEVDQQTIQQSSTGPATRIDPTKFIQGIQQHKVSEHNRMIDHANRMAEMLHPLPQEPLPLASISQPAPQTVSQPQVETFTGQDPNQLTFDFLDESTKKNSLKQLDLIVDYLYSINNKLDRILNRDKHSISE